MKVKTKIKAFALLLILSIIVFACGLSVTQKTYAESVEGTEISSVYAEDETTSVGGASSPTSSSVTSSGVNTASSGCAGGWKTYLLLGIIAIALLGGAWWRNKKTATQRDEQKKKLDSLAVGTEVVTNALIKGKIIKNEGDYFVIVTGDGENKSYLEIHKNAIYMILSEEEAAAPSEEVASEEVKEEDSEENKEVFSDFDAKEEKESVQVEEQPTETEEKSSESEDKTEE